MQHRIPCTLLALCLTGLIGCLGGDPCSTFKKLTHPFRHISYTAHGSHECDEYIIDPKVWYQFLEAAGNRLADSDGLRPTPGRCGTKMPLYLQNKHPDIDCGHEKNNVPLCINLGIQGYECIPSKGYTVRIRKCCGKPTDPQFYIYQLPKVKQCDMVICGEGKGNTDLCTGNQRTIGGECVDRYPTITERPKMLPVKLLEGKIKIGCQVNFKTLNTEVMKNARFRVMFMVNGYDYEESLATDISNQWNKLIGYMDEKHLKDHLGTYISCKVQSYWKDNEHLAAEKSTYYASSNNVFVGIKVLDATTKQEVTEIWLNQKDSDKEVILELVSTIPITPDTHNDYDVDKKTSLLVRIDASKSSDGIAIGECFLSITEDDWTGNQAVSKKKLRVAAQITGKINTFVPHAYILWKTKPGFDPAFLGGKADTSIWKEYTLKPVRIRIKEVSSAECRSYGDPHIFPFDNNARYFNSYVKGEFLLARHPSSGFEVRVRQFVCNKVACNCGVSAREGNDIYIVDLCHKSWKLLRSEGTTPKIMYKNPKCSTAKHCASLQRDSGSSMKRDPSAKDFMMAFPSGAYVRAVVSYWGLSITVHAPSTFKFDKDDRTKKEMTGFCGNYDGDSSNDMPKIKMEEKFHKDYKINKVNSYFEDDTIIKEFGGKDASNTAEYCHCSDKSVCRPVNKVTDTASYAVKMTPFDPDIKVQKRNRKRRDLNNFEEEDDSYDFDFNEKLEIPVVHDTWPTASGRTEAEVENICKTVIMQSPVYGICKDVQGFDVFATVQACKDDIQISDDISFASTAALEMQDECIEQAGKFQVPETYPEIEASLTNNFTSTTSSPANIQSTRRHKTTTTSYQIPIVDVEKILDKACPGQCSYQGKCVNGNCICSAPYIGADCSIDGNSPPVITRAKYQGLCNFQYRSCDKVTLSVSHISENVTCKVIALKIDINAPSELLPNTDGEITEGQIRSYGEMTCAIPLRSILPPEYHSNETGSPVQGYLISISNDGNVFSNTTMVTVYDSKCISCSATGNCTKKPGTCLINGYCYEDMEHNPVNWCYEQCSPPYSDNKWKLFTPKPDCVKCNGQPCHCSKDYNWQCTCGDGYQAKNGGCEDIDECLNPAKACGHNAKCTNSPGAYFCECQPGFTGQAPNCTDFDECKNSHSCPGNSNCVNEIGNYRCECHRGFSGTSCTDIDECSSLPSICTNANSMCINNPGSYQCVCLPGFIGPTCADKDKCTSETCAQPNTECMNIPGSYKCQCKAGYEGPNCSDIDECASLPSVCTNANSMCINTHGSYQCTCIPGFIGPTCIDIDECLAPNSSCGQNAKCTNIPGSYLCECQPGFTGQPPACTDIDECLGSKNACGQNAKCINVPGSYSCECQQGFTGQPHRCLDINECVSDPANNCTLYESCENLLGSYICQKHKCPRGYVANSDAVKCFYYSDEKVTYQEAFSACQKSGGALLQPRNNVEYKKFITRDTKGDAYWLGVTDLSTEGVFTYNDGSPLNITRKWHAGHPLQNGKNMDCVIMDGKLAFDLINVDCGIYVAFYQCMAPLK